MAEPFPKEQQLARGERRHHRRVASKGTWQRIIDAKRGPCRVCGSRGAIQLHHLLSRAQGGDDVEENIVSLCSVCHHAVTGRDKQACRTLRLSLTVAEITYAVDTMGEARFDSRYPLA